MRTKLLLTMLALLIVASPMFAQGTTAAAESNHHWLWIASGFSMAFASGLCGLAQSRAIAAACEGMGRNPGASDGIRFALILGLAFIESLALFTFAIIFSKVV